MARTIPCVSRDAVGQVAQLVEQRTENPCVGSSILPLSTFLSRGQRSRGLLSARVKTVPAFVRNKKSGRRRVTQPACYFLGSVVQVQTCTIALRFFKARTRTLTLAGLAGRSCNSPVKGFFTPFWAGRAGTVRR